MRFSKSEGLVRSLGGRGVRGVVGLMTSAAMLLSSVAAAASVEPFPSNAASPVTANAVDPTWDPSDIGTVLPKRHEFARVLMGVPARIVIHSSDEARARSLAASGFERIAAIEDVASDYRSFSELMRVCDAAGAGPTKVSRDLLDLLEKSVEISRRTGGAFDARVGSLVRVWREARKTGVMPDASALADARAAAMGGWRVDRDAETVSLDRAGMRLDLGGIAKGSAAALARDLIVELANASGETACMVSLAGDIAVGDAPPGEEGWRIAIENGVGDGGRTVVVPAGWSISTSGDFEQFVEIDGIRYAHIVDPATGLGSTRRAGATAMHRDGATADALATALYLRGVEGAPGILAKFTGAEALIEERVETRDGGTAIATHRTAAFGEQGAAWFDPQNVPPAGFTALFNGRDLAGWQGLIDGPPMVAAMNDQQKAAARTAADERMRRHWRVEDGVLVFDGKGDSLQSIANYRDFELFVDWRISAGGDSGIYLRGSPQVQIWDDALGSGGLYNNQGHRSTPLVKADRPVGEWNRFHIIMRGDHVTVYLNDVLVVDDTVLENYWERGARIYATGPIELQNHGNRLEFKNIFVRELAGMPESADADGARMSWWRESRFGMFIHWGLYAIPAGEWNGVSTPGIGEWIMHDLRIPPEEYEKLAPKFNPVRFDADAWVKMAADAGVKYIVITTKHHDGFSLFDSAHSSYDIVDATPFKRDIMKELSEACARHRVRMCWYHSIWDWHHPDAQKGETYPKYVEVLRSQVTELLTKYGPIGAMWFDGEWDKNWTNEMGWEMYRLCRTLQPWTIVNNRVGKGRQGMAGLTAAGDFPGDFGTPEQEIPATGLAGEDWESCMTMNNTWGFVTKDENWKSPTTLVRMLIETTSKGGNFLLNVGPTAEGVIPAASVERFAAIGEWMKVNSSSIHGAGASPFRALPWGRCTTKPGTLYLHVFERPADGAVVLPGLMNAVRGARLLVGGGELKYERDSAGWRIMMPESGIDPHSTVIVVTIDGEAAVVEPTVRAAADGSLTLRAIDARLDGHGLKIEGMGDQANVGFWTSAAESVRWTASGVKPGRYAVEVELACDPSTPGAKFAVEVSGAAQVAGSSGLTGTVESTGSWKTYAFKPMGEVDFPGGTLEVLVRATSKPGTAVMNLRSVRLVPKKP
jgi:alpha-L-fucosidase